MSISSIDLRLGRVCMARSDITDSLREQQAMLNVLALTFDLGDKATSVKQNEDKRYGFDTRTYTDRYICREV